VKRYRRGQRAVPAWRGTAGRLARDVCLPGGGRGGAGPVAYGVTIFAFPAVHVSPSLCGGGSGGGGPPFFFFFFGAAFWAGGPKEDGWALRGLGSRIRLLRLHSPSTGPAGRTGWGGGAWIKVCGMAAVLLHTVLHQFLVDQWAALLRRKTGVNGAPIACEDGWLGDLTFPPGGGYAEQTSRRVRMVFCRWYGGSGPGRDNNTARWGTWPGARFGQVEKTEAGRRDVVRNPPSRDRPSGPRPAGDERLGRMRRWPKADEVDPAAEERRGKGIQRPSVRRRATRRERRTIQAGHRVREASTRRRICTVRWRPPVFVPWPEPIAPRTPKPPVSRHPPTDGELAGVRSGLPAKNGAGRPPGPHPWSRRAPAARAPNGTPPGPEPRTGGNPSCSCRKTDRGGGRGGSADRPTRATAAGEAATRRGERPP